MPMKSLLSVLTLVLTAATLTAQVPPQIYSRPAVPPREALERLNLVHGWHTYIPMESMRDGIYSVQLAGPDMLVQTRSGLIACLEAETGRTRWRTMPGQSYNDKQPLGFNSRLVVACNGTHLYAFDRSRGGQVWAFDLPTAPIAAPVLDEEQLYIPLGGARLEVYVLADKPPPPPKKGEGIPGVETMPKPAGPPHPPPTEAPPHPPGEIRDYLGPYTEHMFEVRAIPPSLPLLQLYEQLHDNDLDRAPLVTPEFLLMADTRGSLVGMSKFRQREVYRIPTGGPISAPLAQHGETAYIASADQNVYALNQVTGRVLWRFTTPTAVYWEPQATDNDVYLSSVGSGMYRLQRDSGELLWHNATAQRFLAANPKFVYATDSSNRLVILDQRRGTALSGLDTRDYVVPISNHQTDRLYLAAHDGLVLCLHDRQYTAPAFSRRPPAPPPGPVKPPPPKPPAEKPPADQAAPKPDAGAGMDKEK
jgi:outer membrane protein assembly factor BamB